MTTSLTSQRMRAGTVALAACLLGAAAGIASAAASTAADVRTMRVSYGDLNLATEQGSRALYTRLESAARAVCEPEDGRNLAEVAAARACEARAIAQAVKDVHSPMLAANRVQG
ncbi:MAG: UrcA family protein [Steroidobacteraceae bacterium]